MLRLSYALLLLVLTGCTAKYWQDKEYAGLAATPQHHECGVGAVSLLKVLDGLAQILYTEGFYFETNGPDLRPPSVFSQDSSFRVSRSFDAQTTFVIVEAPTQEISCVVNYTDSKEVYVRFFQNRVTSPAKPHFPMSAARKSQIDQLVEHIRAYLQEKLPSYRIVVSPLPQSA